MILVIKIGGVFEVETDFTTQLLYVSIKSGINVRLEDLGLNVLFDLLNYSAQIDNATLQSVNSKSVRKSKPMNIAEMTLKKRTML